MEIIRDVNFDEDTNINKSIKYSLHSELSMTDLGLLKQFLVLEIEQYDVGIKFNQQKYAAYLLSMFKMAECNTSKFPFLLGVKPGDFGESPLVESSLYKQLVRSLLYLTHSQPDLAYYVGVIAMYMKEPHDIH